MTELDVALTAAWPEVFGGGIECVLRAHPGRNTPAERDPLNRQENATPISA